MGRHRHTSGMITEIQNPGDAVILQEWRSSGPFSPNLMLFFHHPVQASHNWDRFKESGHYLPGWNVHWLAGKNGDHVLLWHLAKRQRRQPKDVFRAGLREFPNFNRVMQMAHCVIDITCPTSPIYLKDRGFLNARDIMQATPEHQSQIFKADLAVLLG